MGWLYDAVFTGWGWRRKGDPEIEEPNEVVAALLHRLQLSHESRAAFEEEAPYKVTFRSALRHLMGVVELCRLSGVTKPWHLRSNVRHEDSLVQSQRRNLSRLLSAARRWAVSKCESDLDQRAVGEICPLLLDKVSVEEARFFPALE